MTSAEGDDLSADFYVLGLLEEADRAEAARRVERDADFAGRVAGSARRFAPLDATARPVALPAGAWERLEDRLAERAEPAASAESARSAEPAAAAAAGGIARGAPPAANENRPRRTAWAAAGAAAAAAILLAVGVSLPFLGLLPFAPAGPAAVAVLLDPEGAPFALIEDFGGGEAAVTTLAAYEVPADRSLEVWSKWSEEVGPVSLGVLDAFAGAPVGAAGLPEPVAGQLYEITLEAEGGSATGRPTGEILGIGRASIPR